MNFQKFKKPESKGVIDVKDDKKPRNKERATERVLVMMTSSEKAALETLAEKRSHKLSPLVKSLLKEHGYI